MNTQNENLYRKIEGMLYSYPKIKAEIENIKLDMEELNDNVIGISGASDNKIKPSTSTYAFSSNVENEVVNKDERMESLNRLLRSKERFIEKIDNSLEILSDDEQILVSLKYFKRQKLERVAEVLQRSVVTIVRKRKTIIVELMSIL